MPMKVRNLIAKQFVIQLPWMNGSLNRLCQQAHFIELSDPLVVGQLVELRGVTARDQDAVALVILPWTEQSDRVRKLPDQFFIRQRIETGQLEAERTFGGSHTLSRIGVGPWRERRQFLEF